ncbi:MAG TPA: hypothetical protein VM869_02245, partial [Enhygromyxa sp.]|nr:hypothetical protein [Enhygromyxa sp.]
MIAAEQRQQLLERGVAATGASQRVAEAVLQVGALGRDGERLGEGLGRAGEVPLRGATGAQLDARAQLRGGVFASRSRFGDRLELRELEVGVALIGAQ